MAAGGRKAKKSKSNKKQRDTSASPRTPQSDTGSDVANRQRELTSTTSLGKRRRMVSSGSAKADQSQGQKHHTNNTNNNNNQSQQTGQQQLQHPSSSPGPSQSPGPSGKKRLASAVTDYGSQSSPMRIPMTPNEITKVTVIGGAGGIGQPLSMLLMLHTEYVQHVAVYDVTPNTRGVAADISHIDRQCRITAHTGPDELADAVKGSKLILIPAGLAQKPGMSRDDLFGSNALIMYDLARVCAQTAPNAILAIISNPVNSLVPLACEVYSKFCAQKESESSENHYSRRIFGVTTLDVVRSSSFLARSAFYKPEPSGLFVDPTKINVPVIGGHAGRTIVPILSQATPKIDEKRFLEDKSSTQAVVATIQEAGIKVLEEKKGTGSATLSMAYSACRFAISVLRAMQGEQNIVECAYVKQSGLGFDNLDYFATPLVLGKHGWVKSQGLGKLLPFEQQMVADAVRELKTNVAKGEDFAKTRDIPASTDT